MSFSSFQPGDLDDGSLNEFGEEIRRRFDPLYSPMHRDVPESKLVIYTPSKKVSQLQVKHPRTGAIELDIPTVVISIGGACRGNGTPSARGAWGVYFGPQSPHNANGLLDPSLPQTSNRAEVEAVLQALHIIQRDISKDMSLLEIHIKSDSLYLVRSMSEWIEGWIENHGRNDEGRPVKHYTALKGIHERLDEMEYGGDGGLDFKFWHVPPEQNREADALANQALDS